MGWFGGATALIGTATSEVAKPSAGSSIKAALGNIFVSAADAAAGIGILKLRDVAAVDPYRPPTPTATQIGSAPNPLDPGTLILPIAIIGGLVLIVIGAFAFYARRK